MVRVLLVGPIPEKLCVCHRCDNPPCVNPSHLFLGTHKDNSQDMALKGRHRVPALRGTANPAAKLNEEGVRHILSSPENGVNLARRFGISTSQVCDIRKRRAWAHLQSAEGGQ